jgi:hypothetical protein
VERSEDRAVVPAVEETEGGGVGLLRRPLVRLRKALKRVEEEARRSGVRGPSPDEDIWLGAYGWRWWYSRGGEAGGGGARA